jgi:aryl-alcohol dehydrogenase-like predicted oxidoreductase
MGGQGTAGCASNSITKTLVIAKRAYGSTGLATSALGLGAAQIGAAHVSDNDAARLLNAAVDAGITLIDTAPSYGASEERIGKHLASRRNEIVLSTKLGYGIEGIPDWTGPCITAGVERALRVMRTDRIDIAHLHSCPRETLEQGDVIDALEAAKRAGKIVAIAYSGENDDLDYAVATGRFDGFMASLNIFDQGVIDNVLPKLAAAGKGFIAKRPAANHPWRYETLPKGDYCEEYWRRWQVMAPEDRGRPWGETALRFALSVPGVASAIVGTAHIEHLQQNLTWAHADPLEGAWFADLRTSFQRHGQQWAGQI